ncbi:serine-type peptidase [Sporothrix brasiliensis 5110]|uniref:Serine-type peptidase n=1 Tax=Sporothrix brasiliensis 5110 TaxID=1398154 RepID=A0A0C2EZW2_9PEZI|nr:serine-type peptidase [Sporothrix brasiliensis 5110]KIH92084.1 serine-type peptidase [Sporothrix brasiliensis 5110]
MKFAFAIVTVVWAAAQRTVAVGPWPVGFKPPGLIKGTFSPGVSDKVAAASHGRSKGYCGPDPGTPNGGGGGGGHGGSTPPAPTFGWGTFNQPIDHNSPHLGTFSQRFWYSTEFWKGPGSPIVLTCPGEQSGTDWNATYLSNQRITGYFGEAVGGAVVILEHRYWGESSPYEQLTVKNLKYLTVDQALRDFTYFANNWVPPFDTSGKSKPTKAPWVLAGGSYAGALAGWEANLAAGQPEAKDHTSPFWAYYATSGVVEAIGDFWQYFEVVRQATPQNCSIDLTNVASYIDNVLQHGTNAQKLALKTSFKLQDLTDGDFARTISIGPLLLQSTQFFSTPLYGSSPYYQFCDYIENVWDGSGNPVPGKSGVGVTKALAGYAKWTIDYLLPDFCDVYGYDDFQGTYNTECLRFTNASSSMYLDITPGNFVGRQYWWLLCNNPLAWFQTAAPVGQPTIVSRQLDYNYFLEICNAQFPAMAGGFGLEHGTTIAGFNGYTGGWSVPPSRTPRIIYTNGEVDPWRAASVSSSQRPGGPLASSANVPVTVVQGGSHCSDAYAENWAVNPGVKAIVDAEAATMLRWTNEFYSIKHITKPT